MSILGKLKQLKKFLKYKLGEKEAAFDHPLNKYLPENMIDASLYVYLINYNIENDTYTILINSYEQRRDI